MSNTCRSSSMWCCSDPSAAFARTRHPGEGRDPVLLLFVLALIASMVGRAFALTRESLFFVWPKKSNQKKGHPGGAPTLRVGSQSEWEFSNGTSVCLSKTAHILCAALRVSPTPIAAPQGLRTSKSGSDSKIKIKSPPPQSSPALRAREEAGSNSNSNSNSGLHRVWNGLNNCHPFHGGRESLTGSREADLDLRLPATGYRLSQDIHQSNDKKERFIQRFLGKSSLPLPSSPFPASP